MPSGKFLKKSFGLKSLFFFCVWDYPLGDPESYFFENFPSLKNVDLAERLIKAGAKIDAFGGPSLSTPLHLAASYEDTDMVKMLLEYGADPLKKDGDGNLLI